ncbi:hypothetical protein [Rheinheimera pacifica]|uniref:hypothetical protein n=1 Tax=Rheinheimera pacifica TaxID=173990 RepID=UPI002EDB24A8
MQSDELIRIATQQAINFAEHGDWKSYLQTRKFEFTPSIENNSGGSLLIGDEAYETLLPVIQFVINDNNWQRVVEFRDVRVKALELFGDYIFERLNDNDKQLKFEELIENAIKLNLQSYVVYVPCNITESSTRQIRINIGPAAIINIPTFQALLDSDRHKLKFTNYQDIWDECEEKYSQYQWFVEVKTPPVYSYKIASDIASKTALDALNLLHMFIPISHSFRMKTGFGISPINEAHQIYKSGNGNFAYSLSKGAAGNVGIPDRFWDHINQGEHKKWLDVYSKCISLSLDLQNTYPTVNRFLDATYWMGDAIREENSTTRVVKYVTALERLLTFSENGGLKKIISKRGSALLLGAGSIDSAVLSETYENLKKLYQIRSDIVHGIISPTAKNLPMSPVTVDKLVRDIILSFIELVGAAIDSKDAEKKLLPWLKGMVKHYGLDLVDK